jgi:hypothetical protein
MTSVNAQLAATTSSLATIARTLSSSPVHYRPDPAPPVRGTPWQELFAALRRLPLGPVALGGAVLWVLVRMIP